MLLPNNKAGALAKLYGSDSRAGLSRTVPMPGQFRPRGVTMRDCSKNRAGYDRVLMAVAATFLAVSATSALAQAGPPAAAPRNSRSTQRSRVPNPPTCRPRPPTISSWIPPRHVPDAAKTIEPTATEKTDRGDDGQARRAETVGHRDRPAAPPPAAATATPPAEPVKAASSVPPADQPVADKLREMLGAKSLRYFDRKGERAAVEKFYTGARICAGLDPGRRADRQAPRA